MNRIVYRSFV